MRFEISEVRPGFIGIDVAIAKAKRLPVVVCIRENGRLIPQSLRRLGLRPPLGIGNAAMLDQQAVQRFAQEARDYVAAVCDLLGLNPTRIGIDAPSAPRDPRIGRRAAERALDQAGISCFATPSADEFDVIRTKVLQHLTVGGPEDRIPHANQLWMLAGFAIFDELSRLAPCLEVFPQATVRATNCGQLHKSQGGAVKAQLGAASLSTGWPSGEEDEIRFKDIGWGAAHDRVDAYLSAWVASLGEPERVVYGCPPDDAIWVPRIEGVRFTGSQGQSARAPANLKTITIRPPNVPFFCPACGRKEFKRWPWGWDAHAAYTCPGLRESEPQNRKAEFRSRFANYFSGLRGA